MAVDNKYGRVTFERGTIGEDEPVFVLRAQDEVTPLLLNMYKDVCIAYGSPQRHLDSIDAARSKILEWQETHHTQTPRSDPHD